MSSHGMGELEASSEIPYTSAMPNKASLPSTNRQFISNRTIVVVAAAWSLLLIVFAFTDLSISTTFADSASAFGWLIYSYGEIPGVVVGILALYVLTINRCRTSQIVNIGGFAALALLCAYATHYAVRLVLKSSFGVTDLSDGHRAIILASSLGVTLLVLGAFERRRTRFSSHAHRFAWVTASAGIVMYALVAWVLKPLWGRVRFVDLDPDMTLFSLWCIPQGITGHVSFPSGHTVLGWMVLPIVILFERRPKVQRLVAVGAVFWAFLVALGRVRAGAHYASDVTFSSGVTLMLFACAERFYRHRSSEL